MSDILAKNFISNIPLLAMRGGVVFPHTLINFDVGRAKSVKALEIAMENSNTIFLLAQKSLDVESPTFEDLYNVGVYAKIKQVIKLPGEGLRVLLEGIREAKIAKIYDGEYFSCDIEFLDFLADSGNELKSKAVMQSLKDSYEEYFELSSKIAPESIIRVINADTLEKTCNNVSSSSNVDYNIKQTLLEDMDIFHRGTSVLTQIKSDIEILKLEREINLKVKKQIDKNQKQYYLKEQIRVINDELGNEFAEVEQNSEYNEYLEKINKFKLTVETKEKLLKELKKLFKMSLMSPEASVSRNYLDMVLSLPWNTKTKERVDLDKASEILEGDHYGLEKVKERILEYLAVRKLAKNVRSPILCLVGPPGVGKTSIAKSIAEAVNRKYVRVSLGGVRDESDIRGHRKTYIGSMPGRIIAAINQSKSNNPLMLFDEIDKMGSDIKGDPTSAMLEVLDGEQNFEFRDHYLEVPFDLSDVLFLATANSLQTISAPLLDRMEIIEIDGYTEEEKFQIARKYLVTKQMKNHGVTDKNFSIDDAGLFDIIRFYTKEAGVRKLERVIGKICRKSAKEIVEKKISKVDITKDKLEGYLGRKIFDFEEMNSNDEVGIARGLAWTSLGGETLSIEVNVMDGSGNIELTGNLGDVMKESAKAAISYIRSKSDILGVEPDFYKTKDIHLHVPEGAVPKDGPSAGITIATAIISALTGFRVRRDVAMTGEITLRGRVLPIGGLKEKALAAYKAGIKTIIIPKKNEMDISDIKEEIKKEIKFVLAEGMEDVLKHALTTKEKQKDKNSILNSKIDKIRA